MPCAIPWVSSLPATKQKWCLLNSNPNGFKIIIIKPSLRSSTCRVQNCWYYKQQ